MTDQEQDERSIEPPKWMHRTVYAMGAIIVGLYLFIAYETIKEKKERRELLKEKNKLEMITDFPYNTR